VPPLIHPHRHEHFVTSAPLEAALCCIRSQQEIGRASTLSRALRHLDLNGAAGLLLGDEGSTAHNATGEQVADPELHQVTAFEFAVDRQIEHCEVTQHAFALQVKARCPHLLGLQRQLG
jgi:hypothetical protein